MNHPMGISRRVEILSQALNSHTHALEALDGCFKVNIDDTTLRNQVRKVLCASDELYKLTKEYLDD